MRENKNNIADLTKCDGYANRANERGRKACATVCNDTSSSHPRQDTKHQITA
jgi:hypothetical protein